MAHAAEARYDVALVDLNLPDTRGRETIARCKEGMGWLPVVVLTSLDDEEYALSSIQHGAQDYLFKAELDPDVLMRALRYAIERHQLQQELKRRKVDLEHFARAAAHDLKAPLRHMGAFAELLRDSYSDALDAEAHQYLDYMHESARHLTALIDDLLRFARFGHQPSDLHPCSLDDALDDSLKLLQPEIQRLDAHVTREALPLVYGNRKELSLVLQNLLENALRYHSDAPPRVHIAATRSEAHWRVEVTDNGIGVEDSCLESVFAPFVRLHSHLDIPGTGIGLALSRRIIENHQGRLWLEPNPDGGTVAVITLPALPQDEATS